MGIHCGDANGCLASFPGTDPPAPETLPTAALGKPGDDPKVQELEDIHISNLRTHRDRAFEWEVPGVSLVASVHQTTPPHKIDGSGMAWWNLEVQLRHPSSDVQIVSVAPTDGAEITKMDLQKRIVTLKVRAQAFCAVSPPRAGIFLKVQYREGSETRKEDLQIDFRCLVGDSVDGEAVAQGAADLASHYALVDPFIQSLIRERGLAEGSPGRFSQNLFGDLDWLKNRIKFVPRASYHQDPPHLYFPKSPSHYLEHYFLAPHETLRFGGDCEDWSIFVGAYLAMRGFSTMIAWRPGHAWVVAVDEYSKTWKIDWTNGHSYQRVTDVTRDDDGTPIQTAPVVVYGPFQMPAGN